MKGSQESMNPLETLIELIAPHRCLVCRLEGALLCEPCSELSLSEQPSRCYRCHKATIQSKTCQNCRRKSAISHAWVAATYDTVSKKLVYKLKFERAKAASGDMAKIISEHLPILPPETQIVHIPTVNKRVRVRGYDQAELIARDLAKLTHLRHRTLLKRIKPSRQVGSTRKNRFSQLEGAFQATKSVKNKHILLVDDVLTTGATVESAAKILKDAGATTIDVAVFAQP